MNCQGCGGPIQRARYGPPRRYCRRSCQPSVSRSRAKEVGRHRLPTTARRCLLCLTDYIGTRGRRFCSQECGKQYHLEVGRDRRRAIRRTGRAGDRILRRRVFAAANWRCAICRQPVDPALSGRNPMGPTLDHVIPLARGGEHVEANVQLAHLICNQRKGASVAA